MERLDISPKLTPANFKWLLLLLVCFFSLYSGEVGAFWQTDDYSPVGYPIWDVAGDFRPGGGYNVSDCSINQGRVFNFTPTTNYKVSAVSLFFVTYSDPQIFVFNPSQLFVSLFDGVEVTSEKALVFRSRSDYTWGGTFKGVLFPLLSSYGGPVWVEAGKTYTVLLECTNTPPDKHKLLGSPILIKAYGFNNESFSTTSVTFSTPHFQLHYKNDGTVKTRPADKIAPASRPVVFVHGLGGLPSDFSEYIDTLKNSGWDSRYLLSFDYGLKDGQYNNFASLSDELPRLSLAVATLSAMYKTDGGDGKVNLVGYSSGALLAKNFLGNYKASHHVSSFISIAGDFKGSFLADLETGNDFPRATTEATAKLAKIFSPSISSFNPLTYGRTPRDTVFKTQIISTSSQISSFKKEDLPDGIKYYSLQGDIKAASTQKLFKSLVKSEGSIGDGAVLGSSTSDLPNVSSFSFLDSAIATRSVTRSAATVSASFTLPDFSKIKFFHSNLLKAVEIKNKILELLK